MPIESLEAKELFLKGIANAQQGKIQQAIDDLTKALEIEEDYEIYFLRGNVFGVNGDIDKAIEDYNSTIELFNDHSEAIFLRGLSFIEKELFEKAHNDFDRCIEIIPQFSRAYAEKAFIYSKQGKAEDALDYFTKAIELEKDNPIFLYNRSLVLNALERFNEAKNDLDEVIKIDENFIHAYRLRASIYEKLKNEDEFQRDMKKFFELKHEMENRESVKSEK